ncbi:MAG: Flp pilus assembly protein CpaB [Phycisphaera sp.]|nr:Flp pilus assembly protein CpaB [Phycisphaera sp.]
MAEKSSAGNRTLLLASVVCALATMGLTFYYLQSQQPEDPQARVRKVLVARQDIPASKKLDPHEDLTTMEVPDTMTDLLAQAIRPEHIDALRDIEVNRAILAGTPITYADIRQQVDLKLTGDHRALAVPIDPTAAVGGLVVPGDWVKLAVTRTIRNQAKAPAATTPESAIVAALSDAAQGDEKYETTLILAEPLRIIAVGRQLMRERSFISAEVAGPRESFDTVTLDVTEVQALTILEKSGAGQLPLTLILCPAPVGLISSPAGP